LKTRIVLIAAWFVFILTAYPTLSAHYTAAAEEEENYDSRADDEQYYEDDEQDQPYYDEEDEFGAPLETLDGDPVEQSVQFTTSPFDDSVTITEQEIVSLNIVGNDMSYLGSESRPKVLEITEPAFGKAILNSDDTITYSPSQISLPSGYQKTDIIHYTATVDGVTAYSATVTIWIEQLNDPPVAYSANFTIDENKESSFYLGAFDEDNDGLTYSALSTPTFGKTELNPYTGVLVYTPLYEFSGTETLTFQVSDGQALSNIATVAIKVLELGGENSPIPEDDNEESDYSESEDDGGSYYEDTVPDASPGNDQSVLTGDFVTLDGSGSADQDGDPVSFSWLQRTGPRVSLEGAATSNPWFEAPMVKSTTNLTFELSVSDGFMADSAIVTVTVLPIDIDIIPNINPNVIELSEPDTEIPVAVIGSSSLDTSTVSLPSLGFGPDSASALRSELADFNNDGYLDHFSYYKTGDTGLVNGDKTACLTGSLEGPNGNDISFSVCKNIKVKV
jgi:Bacterial Ig domain